MQLSLLEKNLFKEFFIVMAPESNEKLQRKFILSG
jgi:hypothetical protein